GHCYYMHSYKVGKGYVLICDYCLAKIANSFFVSAFNIRYFDGTTVKPTDFFDGIVFLRKAVRLARRVKNKNNLNKDLAKWANLSRQNLHYHLRTFFQKALQP
ncbi:MAG: hypothetical protein QXT92_00005, partial [Nitrososphaerota archaeon]